MSNALNKRKRLIGEGIVRDVPVSIYHDFTNPAAALGRRGGKAGTGKSKRRTKAHYRRLSALGVAARWGKKKKEK